MKYNISLFFLSLFFINANTFSMNDPCQNEYHHMWHAEISKQTHTPAPIIMAIPTPPRTILIPAAPQSENSLTLSLNFNLGALSRISNIIPINILTSAGLGIAVGGVIVAYGSFSAEEKANAGKLKFPFLVALRTGKIILSLPTKIIGLPSKLIRLVKKKYDTRKIVLFQNENIT